jgi:biotin carboxylase
VASVEEAAAFVQTNGLPVIIKAAHGGGGRGMRVVKKQEELEEAFHRCVEGRGLGVSGGRDRDGGSHCRTAECV